MKSWITRFRISNCMDSEKAIPRELQREMETCDDLRAFAIQSRQLGEELRACVPEPEASGLHESIMRAVRESSLQPTIDPGWKSPRWAAAGAFAGVLIFAIIVWGLHNHSSGPGGTVTLDATSAIEIGAQAAQAAPEALISPLAVELDRVERDLANTAQFLLSSVP
jgi:hypothetical protein